MDTMYYRQYKLRSSICENRMGSWSRWRWQFKSYKRWTYFNRCKCYIFWCRYCKWYKCRCFKRDSCTDKGRKGKCSQIWWILYWKIWSWKKRWYSGYKIWPNSICRNNLEHSLWFSKKNNYKFRGKFIFMLELCMGYGS